MNSTIHPTPVAHSRFLPWLMWLLAAVFFFYEFFLQVSPGVMKQDLMREFHFSGEQLGYFTAIYFYAYSLMQIPIGLLMDRYGPRRLLTLAVVLCVLGCLSFGNASGFLQAGFGRLLIGIGSAFALLGCLKITATWFPVERFALLAGLVVTIGMTGAMTGEAPFSSLVDALGWRESMFLLAGIGSVIALLIWFIIKDHGPYTPASSEPKPDNDNKMSLWTGLRLVLANPRNAVTSIYGALMYTPTLVFAGLWGVPFIQQAYGLPDDRTRAAFLTAHIFAGWAAGCPAFGWFSDRIGRRRLPMIVGSIAALLIMILIIRGTDILDARGISLGLALFSFGFFSSAFVLAFTVVKEINPPHLTATAIGFINMVNGFGGAMLQPLVGRILDRSLDVSSAIVNGERLYSTQSYQSALTALPVVLGLAVLLLPFVPETRCRILGHENN